MLALLRDRLGFRRLFVADAISMIGDWLTYVAVGLLAIESPRGVWAVAVVQLAHTLPQTVAAPLAGWLADRMDRRTLLVVASLARGAITAAMAIAAASDAISWVEGLLFVRMAGASFIAAASRAALPRLVEPSELGLANRLAGGTWAAIFALGVALGGVITGALGPTVALAADAVTFAIAAALFARLGALPPERDRSARSTTLLADARAHPARVRAALAKVPSQIANGGAWIVLHALVAASAHAALGLGALHATRGIGNGLGPFVLRRLGARRMIVAGGALTAAGGLLVALGHAWSFAIGSLLWGLGVGAAWVGSTTVLQRTAPDEVLGRYAALDVGATSVATALSGVCAAALMSVVSPLATVAITGGVALLFAIVLRPRARLALAAVAIVSLSVIPIDASSQDALRAQLAARAVTDRSFVHAELYTFTTEEQARALRESRALLTAGPGDGALRSPYQHALDGVIARGGESGELARLLTEHPSLSRRRYAWPTPYGTVLARGTRGYGTALVRIRLARDAWTVRFAADETPPFSVVDGEGRPVPLAAARAQPARIGAVYHVRRYARLGPYREYIVHGAARIESWTIGEALRDRWRDDLTVLARVRRAIGSRRPRPLAPFWIEPPTPSAPIAEVFAATMPFDTPRHRPSAANLRELERRLRRARPRGPTLEVSE